ncbi:hypothetical protein GCM10009609_72760 [Pseudonocardia aurantiaca]
MTMTGECWRSYWADKTTPQYVREDEERYREYAGELRFLFPDPPPARVLVIGCGNGALSERMLGVFRESVLTTPPKARRTHRCEPSRARPSSLGPARSCGWRPAGTWVRSALGPPARRTPASPTGPTRSVRQR